ncbi:hypothetical protein [Pseudomonas aeruginosa]
MSSCISWPTTIPGMSRSCPNWWPFSGALGFHDYGRLWLQDGNAKGAAAETLLRDLFGLNGAAGSG